MDKFHISHSFRLCKPFLFWPRPWEERRQLKTRFLIQDALGLLPAKYLAASGSFMVD